MHVERTGGENVSKQDHRDTMCCVKLTLAIADSIPLRIGGCHRATSQRGLIVEIPWNF